MRILLILGQMVDARGLEYALRTRFPTLDVVANERDCANGSARNGYDAIVVVQSRAGGVSDLVQRLRKNGVSSPLIVAGGRNDSYLRTTLLDAGADACLSDPVSSTEVIALVEAITRRRLFAGTQILTFGDLTLDVGRREVRRGGRRVDLTVKEFALVEYLARMAGRVVTRSMVVEKVWGSSYYGLTNIVDVYISSIRRKMDGRESRPLIRTVRGLGYCLSTPSRADVSGELPAGYAPELKDCPGPSQ